MSESFASNTALSLNQSQSADVTEVGSLDCGKDCFTSYIFEDTHYQK